MSIAPTSQEVRWTLSHLVRATPEEGLLDFERDGFEGSPDLVPGEDISSAKNGSFVSGSVAVGACPVIQITLLLADAASGMGGMSP